MGLNKIFRKVDSAPRNNSLNIKKAQALIINGSDYKSESHVM